MIISHRSLLVVAISVLGLAGWKSQAADQPDAADQAVEKPAGAETPKLLLLNDGRILSGEVSEEDEMIILTQPAGVMRFPARKVVRAFSSIQEIHQYKLDRVPEEDMDEQLKLAQWCMSQGLVAEANEHLKCILKIDPKHGRAKAMTASIRMTETRMANARRDADVQQTGAEVVEPAGMGRPATLAREVVRGAQRGMGVNSLPIIFDLPPGAALKRADEFKNYVHPVVQAYCVKCHNDRYEGEFHLIPFKTRVERTPETLRANLDAVLRLVDREVPGRSELLASSLRPHGTGPNTRPIFQGSNDKAYQILAAWVNNLRVKPAPAAGSADAAPAATDGPAEGFAVDRVRINQGSVNVEPVAGGPTVGSPFQMPAPEVIPPTRYVPGQGFVADAADDPGEFPIPFAVSGVKPKLPAAQGEPAAPVARPPADPAAAVEPGDEAPAAAKKPAKPLKLDPALLQRALQLKNRR